MNDWEKVRIRDAATGALRTTTRVRALADGHTILDDHPAVDEHGSNLPVKPRKNPKRAESATTQEEA